MASYPRTRRPSRAPRGIYHERYNDLMERMGYMEQMGYDDRYEVPPRRQPRRQSRLSTVINWTINLAIVAFIAASFTLIWPAAMARWQGTGDAPVFVTQPSAAPLAAPQAQPRAVASDRDTSAPIEQAPAVDPLTQPQRQVNAPPAAPALPTTEIAVPAPVAVVRPDLTKPLNLAPGSIVPTAASAPTVVTTAPMVEGRDYSVSADGRCVLVTNNRGRRVQFCQDAEWTPGAQSSVADYLRTGMIAGEEVK